MSVTHIRAFLALVIVIVNTNRYQNCYGKRHVWRGVGVIHCQLLTVSNVHQTLKLILDYDKNQCKLCVIEPPSHIRLS